MAYLNSPTNVDVTWLNDVSPRVGFITKNYSEGSGRLYFSKENGMIIDGVLGEIDSLPHYEKIISLAALICAADKVANTTSVYGAHLKKLKKSSQKRIEIIPLDIEENCEGNLVFNNDATSLIREISGDILYLDPPYNTRQYSSNYHILNTIAKNDTFAPKGKTGQRLDNFSSSFCSKKRALCDLEKIVREAKFRYVFISYNNEGIISSNDIREMMSKYGRYVLNEFPHKTYKADSNRNNKSIETMEYIHCLTKGG